MKKKTYDVHFTMSGYQFKHRVKAHSAEEAIKLVESPNKFYCQAVLVKDPNRR